MKKNWKIILEYELGILILIITVLAALFGPDFYASWQDEWQLGHTALSNRDNIRFLDVDSLDIAEKMSALKDAESLLWQVFPLEYKVGYGAETNGTEIFERERSLVKEWAARGILPEYAELLIPENTEQLENMEYEGAGERFSLLAGQSMLNVIVIVTATGITDGTLDPHGNPGVLFAVMDDDKDILYYAGVFGAPFGDWMAGLTGPEHAFSYEALRERWSQGMVSELQIVNWGDLAAVCGAQDCVPEPDGYSKESAERMFRNFKLRYDNFDGSAQMQLVRSQSFGYGMAAMIGTACWNDWMTEVMEYLIGDSVIPASAEMWLAEGMDSWEQYRYGMAEETEKAEKK